MLQGRWPLTKIEREWDKHTDIATYRLNWPSGEFSENCQYNQKKKKMLNIADELKLVRFFVVSLD